ncbi:MAG: hypothetical protein MHM6MM_007486 [Cercozoa sp. M6MM]
MQAEKREALRKLQEAAPSTLESRAGSLKPREPEEVKQMRVPGAMHHSGEKMTREELLARKEELLAPAPKKSFIERVKTFYNFHFMNMWAPGVFGLRGMYHRKCEQHFLELPQCVLKNMSHGVDPRIACTNIVADLRECLHHDREDAIFHLRQALEYFSIVDDNGKRVWPLKAGTELDYSEDLPEAYRSVRTEIHLNPVGPFGLRYKPHWLPSDKAMLKNVKPSKGQVLRDLEAFADAL